ncbi:pleiotropic regulatory protein RsmS [Photobacterium japonica]|uniref:pleiotropic regulatory protein RsmS n=1 Tax=Photobacterium japonica TaxID=2910235 RepID=UPI003D13C21A
MSNTNEKDEQAPAASPLDNAPAEVKLAVDLIYLLESNEIDPKVALAALAMVKSDLERKVAQEDNETRHR